MLNQATEIKGGVKHEYKLQGLVSGVLYAMDNTNRENNRGIRQQSFL